MKVTERIFLSLIFPFAAIYYCIISIVKLFTPNRLLKEKDINVNDIVLITGGGMGIGREMAKKFVQHGCKKLIIWDINVNAMDETKKIIEVLGCQVWTFKVDVTNYQQVLDTAQIVRSTVGTVTYLVNNAGIVAGKPVLDLTPKQVSNVMNVNTVSHFYTVQAFLPGMLRERNGHIITIASVLGFLGCAFMTEYSSSKFAAYGFHYSLRSELQYLPNGKDIRTTVVCPWAIDTGMFDGINPGLLAFLKPEYVAQAVLDAVLANRDFLVIPFSLRLLAPLIGLLPNQVIDMLFRITSNPTTSLNLKGRKLAG